MLYAFYNHNTVLLNTACIMCQVEHFGGERKLNHLAPCWRLWKALCTYHGQLGLKLNFQGLQSPFQFCYLTLGRTGCPSISRDLCLQWCTLNKNKMQSLRADEMSSVGYAWPQAWPLSGDDLTCLLNCSSASRRFCSARASYCALMSFSNLVRSVPGAAFISTVTSPPELPCILLIS